MSPRDATELDPNERLSRLERHAQRLRGLVVLLVLIAVVQTVWKLMPGPSAVIADHFILRHGSDPVRGEFYLWADGTPALRLNNSKGEARALWSMRKDGTLSLHMSDTRFTTRLELLVDPNGRPSVVLYGSDGHSRARVGVNSADQAVFEGMAR